jgi:class 3 adenylate cyclase
MPVGDGRVGNRALLALLVLLYLVGVWITLYDKWQRVGQPDVGWVDDGANVAPSRWDAAAAGLFGGGRAIELNSVPFIGLPPCERLAHLHLQNGASNTLKVMRPGGVVRDVTLTVRPLEWSDVVFSEGATVGLGALFAAIGIISFALRPFATSSWALLALCLFSGGVLTTQLLPIGPDDVFRAAYFRLMVGMISVSPLYGALAFPVVHPVLVRRPNVVLLIYALGFAIAALQFSGWYTNWSGFFRHAGGAVDTPILLLSLLTFAGRCLYLAVRASDPVIAQRARILLAGAIAGVAPVVVVNFMRNTFQVLVIDMRITYWALSLFLLALGYITVRHDLLNARIAVRRAVIYAVVVGVLTTVAIVLIAIRPYAVAFLLLPLLYWWPRFDARLNAWLYPQRARFPELIRNLGNELASCATVTDGLDTLAKAPARLCDARSAVAFVLPSGDTSEEVVRTAGVSFIGTAPLTKEPLIQLMVAMRKEVAREHIAVDPQYANIMQDCYACFRRLNAEVLLPLLRDQRVIGGLAIGARASGDFYEPADIEALSTVAQQAVQSLVRIEATERLRARELEFADLKRFFPPQIIDQVMAKGGAAELHSQRKVVTVLFADLRGFTSFADSVEPEEVMATLAEYHHAMGRHIAASAGTLERFAGDGFMVFFNDPVDQPDHVERAARMALAMFDEIRDLRDRWVRKGYQIDVGMGMHTGYATCGFVGYEGRRDYAVIGTVTNLAARLSSAAGGGEILISTRVHGELGNDFRSEPVGELALKGFQQPQATYRLLRAETSGG